MFQLVALLSITEASSADYHRDQGAPDPDQGAVDEDPGNRSRPKHKAVAITASAVQPGPRSCLTSGTYSRSRSAGGAYPETAARNRAKAHI
jgi:hypothetical protein